MPTISCFEDLMAIHQVDITDLQLLYDETENFFREKGVQIKECTKDEIYALGRCIYKIKRRINNPNQKVITCKANNTCMYIEKDMNRIGGLCGRLFDILHIGGHIAQWNCEKNSWEFGVEEYPGNPAMRDKVYEYELNAAEYGISNLEEILRSQRLIALSQECRQNILNLFDKIFKKDIAYIADVVSTGIYKVFFDGSWDFDFYINKKNLSL